MSDGAREDEILQRLAALEQQLVDLRFRLGQLERAQRAPAPSGEDEARRRVREALANIERNRAVPPQQADISPPIHSPTAPARPVESSGPSPLPPPAFAPTAIQGPDVLSAAPPELEPVAASTAASPTVPPLPRPAAYQPPPPPRYASPAAGETGAQPTTDLAAILEKLKLRPPRGGLMEMQVGTWWAARIGILFVVICAVFVAVHVSRGTPPWVKFLGVAAASAGVTLLGRRLERAYEKLGAVIFAGGLSMIFFTAFAAHVIPPVKVLHDPTAGALAQLLTAGAILFVADRRRSAAIAAMAVFFGYVAALFSFSAGLNNFALFAAWLLGLIAGLAYLHRGWRQPLTLAVPFTWFITAIICVLRWIVSDKHPGLGVCLGVIAANFLLFGVADFLGLLRGKSIPPLTRKALVLLNSTAAAGLGFLVTYVLFHDRLETYYFLFGGLLVSGALAFYLSRRPDAIMHAYFVKGSALMTLGVIDVFDARTRWIALFAESFVLLASARRSRLRIVEGAMALVWMVSFLFFVHQTGQAGYFANPNTLWSSAGILSLAYLLASAWLFCLQARWLGGSEANGEMRARSANDAAARTQLNSIYAVLLGATALVVATAYVPVDYRPLGLAALGALTAAVALPGRHWIPRVGGLIPFLAGHLLLWKAALVEQTPSGALWLNLGLLVAMTVALAVALARKSPLAAPHDNTGRLVNMEAGLHALWMISLHAVLQITFSMPVLFMLAAFISLTAAAIAVGSRFRRLADLSVLPLALAALGFCFEFRDISLGQTSSGQTLAAVFAVAGAFAFACATACYKPLADRIAALRDEDTYQWLHTLLALLIGALGLLLILRDDGLMLALALAALAVSVLARWPGLRPAYPCASIYLISAHLKFYALLTSAGSPTSNRFLVFSLAVGLLTLAYAVVARRLRPELRRETLLKIHGVFGVLTLILIYVLFLNRRDWLHDYCTVFWGLAAIGVFLLGFRERSKAFRLVGFGGLVFCIPRILIVDMQSSLERIAACGGLGALFLIVAFLYHKYKGLLERMDETAEGD